MGVGSSDWRVIKSRVLLLTLVVAKFMFLFFITFRRLINFVRIEFTLFRFVFVNFINLTRKEISMYEATT